MSGCADCSCKSAPVARRQSTSWELAAVVGSLVASNCCVLQLLLNYLSIGCAGFSVFDKAKPYAKTLTVIAIIRLLVTSKNRRALWFAAVSALLLVSQDVLAMYNKGLHKSVPWPSWTRTYLSRTFQPTTQTQLPAEQHGDAPQSCSKFRFHVAGIKCEGCAAHLKAALQAVDRVDDVSIDFQLKEVELSVCAQPSDAVDIAALKLAIQAVDATYDPVLMEPGNSA